MTESSGAVHDATLIGVTLPLVPGLVDRLGHGIDVADAGCGSCGVLLGGCYKSLSLWHGTLCPQPQRRDLPGCMLHWLWRLR
jgi:hypothetical protein